MRQQGDENFIKLLNNVRVGEIRQDDIDLLKARQVFDNSNLPSDCIYLFAENKSKDEVNDQKLSELPFPEIVSYASDIVPKGITKQKLDQINERSQSQCAGLAKCLTVKENAKVMLTSNIDISDRLINGQIGIIHSFVYENMNLKVIYVRFNDNEAGLKKRQSDLFAISNNVVPITKVEASIPVTLHSSNCFITRTQFPLMLSWASTIHKVQGLTLSNALVSFKLDKQKTFNHGQIYVALSRVKSLNNLFIMGDINVNSIVVDKNVVLEYERLRKICNVQFGYASPKFSIALLNIRSIFKHSDDLSCDPILMKSNLIFLTETQLFNNDCYDILKVKFKQHQLLLHNNEDKFKSLALLKNEFIESYIEYFDAAIYAEFNNIPGASLPLSVLLLYKSNNQPITDFMQNIRYLVTTKLPDIILGDFNIDLFKEASSAFVQTLEEMSYSIKLKSPTHIRGGLIDHVYFSHALSRSCICNILIHPLYYSDHDAILLQFDSI